VVVDDLRRLSAHVIDTLGAAVDRDWSVPAGTLEWSCWQTLDHTVDCVFSYALFLASERTAHGYPAFGELHALPDATPADLVEGLRAVTTMLAAVIEAADPSVRAVIRRDRLGAPVEFIDRGAHEMILHAHDICAGLDVPFDPPRDICAGILEARGIERASDDPWRDLLESSGRRLVP
jgi:hypothetical protein